MGKKEQVLARAIFVLGSLWVWSATSRGRPPRSRWRDGGLQSVAGIKKTGSRGTPPFLSLSTHPTRPTPWFLSFGRHPRSAGI